jgi:hypothetical protein
MISITPDIIGPGIEEEYEDATGRPPPSLSGRDEGFRREALNKARADQCQSLAHDFEQIVRCPLNP